MMLSGPFWGILGDRYGRKKNILRSAFGSALVLIATGLVTDVYQLVIFRMVLGTVAGTLPTVLALGASTAPRDKGPFVVGLIQSASFLGFTVGPVIGGQLADHFGYRPSFFITGSLAAVCGLLVVLFVREEFQKPERPGKLGPHLFVDNFRMLFRTPALASGLLIMLLAQVGPTMMMPALPVFIGELSVSGTAASNTGVAFSIMGCMAAASSVVFGKLSQRTGTKPILVASFVLGSLLNLPLLFAGDLAVVYVVIASARVLHGRGQYDDVRRSRGLGLAGAAGRGVRVGDERRGLGLRRRPAGRGRGRGDLGDTGGLPGQLDSARHNRAPGC